MNVAIQLLLAAAAISAAHASENAAQQPAGSAGANQAADDRTLRYDGHDFDHWRRVLATELNPDRQSDALHALGAFAANGRSQEAAAAIAAFMNKAGRLPADETAQAVLIKAAVQAIARADEADVMALVPDSPRFAGDPSAEFWRKTQAHFARYSKSYQVAELVDAGAKIPDRSRNLERLVAELKAQFPPKTWHEDGGKCDIAPFETNQSLVVSAPASVHRAMEKALANLRRTGPLTRQYHVGHLISAKSSINRAKKDFDAIADLIKTTIHPTSWESVGGAGTIHQDHASMMLAVGNQSVETHEQIADLLKQLTLLAGKASSTSADPHLR